MSLAAGPTGQNVLRPLAGHLRILLHRTDQHNRLGFKFFPAHIPVMVRGFARMKVVGKKRLRQIMFSRTSRSSWGAILWGRAITERLFMAQSRHPQHINIRRESVPLSAACPLTDSFFPVSL